MNPYHNLYHAGIFMNPPRFRVILAYKNFAASKNVSHIGLGVAGMNTSKVLREQNVIVEVWPIVSSVELRKKLNLSQNLPRPGEIPVTHVVVSAPWVESNALQQLTMLFPNITFSVNCHSNVGFLQADANGCRLFTEAIELEKGVSNFHVAGNSRKFVEWVQEAYGVPCAWLPNLYWLDTRNAPVRPLWNGGVLRIGALGATRPLKNFMSAVGGAIAISRQLKTDTEIWLSTGRAEGGGDTILRAARALAAKAPHIEIKENGWQTWPQFVESVGRMHVLMQPSYTESFNMVTADGISRGVPSVVSDAIDWVPEYWQAYTDNASNIARVGRHLLTDPYAAQEGYRYLQRYVATGTAAWLEYFNAGRNL